MTLRNTYQLGFDLVVAVFHQGYLKDQIHVSVVLVENDQPIVFAHCILACYMVLVCGNQSIAVGSYYGRQQEFPMLAWVVQVDAFHQPKGFKTISHHLICDTTKKVYCSGPKSGEN